MATTPDCKEIEKCIKDMIFKNKPPDTALTQREGPLRPSNSVFRLNDKCHVSNIEKIPARPLSNINPFPIGLSPNQSSSSKLIDVHVLTNFAAKHMDENLIASKLNYTQQLPHPELEEPQVFPRNGSQEGDISILLDSMSKQIQKSPHFDHMPENPLRPQSKKSGRSNANKSEVRAASDSRQSEMDQKRKAKKNRKKPTSKQKRTMQRMAGLYLPRDDEAVDDIVLNSSEMAEKSSDQEAEGSPAKQKVNLLENMAMLKAEPSYIKVKKNAFNSIGKEYTLSLEEYEDRQGKDIRYRLTCHICSYNTDSKPKMQYHLNSRNHTESRKQNEFDMLLPFLPKPLTLQIEAISNLITETVSNIGLQKEDVEIRKAVFQKIKDFIESKISNCSIDLVGSSATGLGFKSSEVDMVLKVDKVDNTADALESLYQLMKKDYSFDKVVSDFKQKRPGIKFVDRETSLHCNILVDFGCFKINALISAYTQLDARVNILGIAFRYWAKLCQIDQQDVGTLPSFTYSLFLVHFLQQVQPPVLPVLHEVEDFSNSEDFFEKYLSEKIWVSTNTDSVGELWVKLFRFYNFDYKLGEDVISIRSSKRCTTAERSWATKFYAIEEPFSRRNLGYVIPTFQVCTHIHQCFQRTYKYFGYPQLFIGKIETKKTDAFDPLKLTEYGLNKSLFKDNSDSEDSENENDSQGLDLEDHDPDISVDSFIETISNMSLDNPNSETASEQPENTSQTEHSPQKSSEKDLKRQSSIKNTVPEVCIWDIEGRELALKDFAYEFRAVTFKGEKSIPLICKTCKLVGHLKKNCPADVLPETRPLPPMTPIYTNALNKLLNQIKNHNIVGPAELKSVDTDREIIQDYIRNVFPDAILTLFGSFCNGFGFKKQSDMDFCLTFGDRNDSRHLNFIKIIEGVAKELLRHSELQNVVSITSAKVPIVKFTWAKNDLEGDISLYNTLALINTELLDTYSKIDSRVQVIGYGLKYFAKTLGICDASRGSLSSYAYILMVIFYLQQRKPPVIPVLQELNRNDAPPILVDDWDVWFYRDIEKLAEVWPEYGLNKESVGELWVGLFNFYTTEFEWKDYVISIKQLKPLSRFHKLWITNRLAIEDPFDHHHNLGSGLSQKMNSYIVKTFIRGRDRFGFPRDQDFLQNIRNREEAFFFDRSFLNSGCEPPHDRGCGNCGKIGHIAKNCTQEKICSYCRRPGHLIRSCPKREYNDSRRKSEKQHRKKYETKPSDKPFPGEKTVPHGANQKSQGDYHPRSFTSKSSQPQSMAPEKQSMLPLGVPSHRFPPPGFQGRGIITQPPPGFKPNGPQSLNYPPPFATPPIHTGPPFPQKQDRFPQSPPKHFTSSPPKNFAPFHETWAPPRHNLQVERHPMNVGHRGGWQVSRPLIQHPPPSLMMPNQSQNVDHRLRRNGPPYPPNHQDSRW